jgi:trigger factor
VKVEIEDVSQCVKELEITVDSAEALQEYNKVLRSFKNYVVIPGFRKGKAPLNMIERNYGENAKEEFFNQKLGEYYKQALDEKDISPISQGEPIKVEWEKGNDFVAVFKYEIMPQVKIEKYKGIEVAFEETTFKDEMIDATLNDYRNKMATEETPEISLEGDIVKAAVKFLDDEKNITKEVERTFEIGKNSYSKTFNTKVTGLKLGDEVTSKLFTKSQKSEDQDITSDLKDRDFMIEIKEIKRMILPELNDDFAKDLEYDSMKDLRVKVAEELKKKLETDNKEHRKTAILAKLIELNPFDVPPSMVKGYAENMAKPYAEQYKMELEKLVPMYTQMAEFNVKNHFMLEELKKLEKIEITDEDKEKIFTEAAANLNMEVDKYKEMYKKQLESEDFKYSAEERKIMEILESNVKFVPFPKEKKKKDKTEEK